MPRHKNLRLTCRNLQLRCRSSDNMIHKHSFVHAVRVISVEGFPSRSASHLVSRVLEDPGELPGAPGVLACEETDRGSFVPGAPAASNAVDIGLVRSTRADDSNSTDSKDKVICSPHCVYDVLLCVAQISAKVISWLCSYYILAQMYATRREGPSLAIERAYLI